MASAMLPKYCCKKTFIEVQPKGTNSWICKSLLKGRDICLKGLDVHVWSGNQSCIIYNIISGSKNECRIETPCVNQLICPITHTRNTKSMNPPIDPIINCMIIRKRKTWNIYVNRKRKTWNTYSFYALSPK